MNMNKTFLTHIAQKEKIDVKDLLHKLIPDIAIFANIEKSKFKNGFEAKHTDYIPLQVHQDNLYEIYSTGSWSGNTLKVPVLTEYFDNEYITDYRDFQFNNTLTISIDDLFIFDGKYTFSLEGQESESLISQRKETNLYVLIGILLDILVDKSQFSAKEQHNIIENPNGYIFKNQDQLIEAIEAYEMNNHGCKSSTLDKVFSIASKTLRSKLS